ncbi:thioredoxin reductase [Bradyrhizobium sp. USDA 4452]
MKPILVTGIQPGGRLTTTTDVENFPGFAQAVQGPELMEQMRRQAEHVGTSIVFDTIMSVDLSQDPIVAQGDSGDTYLGDALIIATGRAKWLGSPGEADYSGYGISACAVCDGFFYRGKEVVVIGGGNTAVEEALYLTNHASKVTLIHRRDKLRAEQILQDRFFAHPKIEVLWNTEVVAFLGEGRAFASSHGTTVAGPDHGSGDVRLRRRRIRRDRPRPGHRALPRPARHDGCRLHQDRAVVDGDLAKECLVGR